MDQHGVDRAVLVHPEPYGDDHRLVLDCLEQEKVRVKGTCLFYPQDPDAPRKMEELVARQPRIIATRFHAHRGKETYLDSLTSPEVRTNLGEGVRPESNHRAAYRTGPCAGSGGDVARLPGFHRC